MFNKDHLCHALMALACCVGVMTLTACDDDGLTEGDPDYFTTSRGQFTATSIDGQTLYLIPGATAGTAQLTYDGSNPRHWQSSSTATVNVTTYQGDLTLPESVTDANGNQYTLTAIGEQALMGCRSLTTMSIPSTVQSIGAGAFAICSSLTTISIPEGVDSIAEGTFGYCPKLSNITLPSTIQSIGTLAFSGCSSLSSITLPEGLTTIGDRAFFECTGMRSITIPASVTRIGNRAFGGRDGSSTSRIAAFHVLATTPPVLDGTLVESQEGTTPIIYVPASAVSAYQNAEGWKNLTIEAE